jgi:thioredoxin reductase
VSWSILIGLVLVLASALAATLLRRHELKQMRSRVDKRERAIRQTRSGDLLQHPVVDLSRCLGCGTCVSACPEDGVLELVHGQAMVVNGARCVGHAACERECPVGAITVTISNLAQRKDIPVLTDSLEAAGSPGLFLAGEITAHALIKRAIDQGALVAQQVARQVRELPRRSHPPERFDLCVVGAGPAGLACSLEAKRLGLSCLTIDQEAEIGGTVAKYPRRKLVVTQPVELPLYGRLARQTYLKEELIDLWRQVARDFDLPIQGGVTFHGLRRLPDGAWRVKTSQGELEAQNVCLALGRRGTPRKLQIPGEELPKVAYSLLDAQSFHGRRILVVGGGDSAVETALGLAEQPGNEVTLSYRQREFFRIRQRNQARLDQAIANGSVRVLAPSQLLAVEPDAVELALADANGRFDGAAGSDLRERLPNDEVFVMAGGLTPFQLLADVGVSFDPSARPEAEPLVEQGTGLSRALAVALGFALAALAWVGSNFDYYSLPVHERPTLAKHEFLRPGRGLGLGLGIAAVLAILANLTYLLRRSQKLGFRFGSMRAWMTSHVGTGIVALLAALIHSAMSPRDTVAGHALWLLVVLLGTGAIGRYFYARLPRAANGRELELEELRLRLQQQLEQCDASHRTFAERAHSRVQELIDSLQWRSTFFGRVAALLTGERKLRKVMGELRSHAQQFEIDASQLEEVLLLSRQAYRTALAAAHLEDLRAVLNTWRYLHRWLAVLMLVLVALHVYWALNYGTLLREAGRP